MSSENVTLDETRFFRSQRSTTTIVVHMQCKKTYPKIIPCVGPNSSTNRTCILVKISNVMNELNNVHIVCSHVNLGGGGTFPPKHLRNVINIQELSGSIFVPTIAAVFLLLLPPSSFVFGLGVLYLLFAGFFWLAFCLRVSHRIEKRLFVCF